jgi:hypothetical protein
MGGAIVSGLEGVAISVQGCHGTLHSNKVAMLPEILEGFCHRPLKSTRSLIANTRGFWGGVSW